MYYFDTSNLTFMIIIYFRILIMIIHIFLSTLYEKVPPPKVSIYSSTNKLNFILPYNKTGRTFPSKIYWDAKYCKHEYGKRKYSIS